MLILTPTRNRLAPRLDNSRGSAHARISLGSDKDPRYSIRVRKFESCFSKPILARRWVRLTVNEESVFVNKNSLLKRLYWTNQVFSRICQNQTIEEIVENRLNFLSKRKKALEFFSKEKCDLTSEQILRLCDIAYEGEESLTTVLKVKGESLVVLCPKKGIYEIDSNTELGKGATKTVYAAKKVFGSSENYAAASIGNDFDGHKNLAKEVKLLRELPPHEGIIRSISSIPLPLVTCAFLGISSGCLFLQKRYDMTFKEVYQRSLSKTQVNSITLQLLSGLAFIEKKDIRHRDIKPENIFLEEKEGSFEAVIADFSISTKRPHPKETAGTIGFLSPEMCKQLIDLESTVKDRISNKIDVWGLGTCLYPLFFGTQSPAPWTIVKENKLLNHAQSIALLTKKEMSNNWGLEFSEPITEFKELVSWMCHPDPNKRLSASKAFEIAKSLVNS